MDIDWSKAPEGTEAYCEGYWLKRDPDSSPYDSKTGFLCQPINSGWEVAKFKPWKCDGFIYKKDDMSYCEPEPMTM